MHIYIDKDINAGVGILFIPFLFRHHYHPLLPFSLITPFFIIISIMTIHLDPHER